MTPFARCLKFCVFIISFALPAWGGEYVLYAPQPAPADRHVSPQEGILVEKIEIQKGDTLFGLSRKFSGHGMYFPQILLFNSIQDPNLIYSGSTLNIPLHQNRKHISGQSERTKGKRPTTKVTPSARKAAVASPALAPTAELSLRDLKSLGSTRKSTSRVLKKKHAVKVPAISSSAPATPARSADVQQLSTGPASAGMATAAGQQLFESAVKAYRKDDCRTALELLDRYLADNSSSPLAADASLYRAECYLKLSAQ